MISYVLNIIYFDMVWNLWMQFAFTIFEIILKVDKKCTKCISPKLSLVDFLKTEGGRGSLLTL